MSIFTDKSKEEGNIAIGILPQELQSNLDDIYIEYYDIVPDKSLSIYHTFYYDLPISLKTMIYEIQENTFWNKLCADSCKKINVKEMDELYYSNFEKTASTVLSENLYGATGNVVIHKDSHISTFDNVALYRVLIGVSPNENNNVITKFTEFGEEKKINRGDYVIFDFSRTSHQVIKENPDENTPRVLLKLHFLICDGCSDNYIYFLKNYFITYYNIMRYISKTGTDPTTFYSFFFGLLGHFYYYPNIEYIILSLIPLNISILKLRNIGDIIVYLPGSLMAVYLIVVYLYWMRYKLFGVR